MRQPKMFVSVNGKQYEVHERSGYLKAHLNGYFGWTSVWAEPSQGREWQAALVRRIKQVRSGGQ